MTDRPLVQLVRYLTHPQVIIDPDKPVPEWSLNDVGHARVRALANNPGALIGTTRVISSAEVKAVETASPLARALGAALEIRPESHENDRSGTGFLPPDEFERVANQFFAKPKESIRGWERAVDAQARIVAAVEDTLSTDDQGDVLFVGHGGVGTLLYCALSGLPIDRLYDQGSLEGGGAGGCWFAFERGRRTPLSHWQLMENLAP